MDKLELLKLIVTLKGEEKDYVYLREDEKGRYIEYAFIEGAPEHNRCLYWHNKLQPNAIKRNGNNPNNWYLTPVDKIYRLSKFTCGHDNDNDPDKICKVGCPAKSCPYVGKDWTIDEPVKCACWYLDMVLDLDNVIVSFSLDQILRLIERLNK